MRFSPEVIRDFGEVKLLRNGALVKKNHGVVKLSIADVQPKYTVFMYENRKFRPTMGTTIFISNDVVFKDTQEIRNYYRKYWPTKKLVFSADLRIRGYLAREILAILSMEPYYKNPEDWLAIKNGTIIRRKPGTFLAIKKVGDKICAAEHRLPTCSNVEEIPAKIIHETEHLAFFGRRKGGVIYSIDLLTGNATVATTRGVFITNDWRHASGDHVLGQVFLSPIKLPEPRITDNTLSIAYVDPDSGLTINPSLSKVHFNRTLAWKLYGDKDIIEEFGFSF